MPTLQIRSSASMFSRALAVITSALSAIACASPAAAQSFNIDIDASSPTTGAGVPATAYAGAAGQTGTWNSVPTTGAGPFTLRGLNNALTNVTLVRSTSSGVFGFGADNASSAGNHAALLEDLEAINAGVTQTITISNLAVGVYEIYTYAIAPDSSTLRTVVTVSGTAVTVGGVMPVNSFAEGVTHSKHTFSVYSAGTIAISIVGAPGQSGSFSGLQLKQIKRSTIYVRASAPTGGDGNSWATAYRDLQTALAEPIDPPLGTFHSIWVAAGTYKPTTTTDRSATFFLTNGQSIIGGFDGTETSIEDADPVSNPTILSGDIGTIGLATDNSRHILRCVDSAVSINGFRFQDGYDDDTSFSTSGGGAIFAISSTVRVSNCLFQNNTSIFGGGAVFLFSSSGSFFNSTFLNNNVITGSNSRGGAINAVTTSRVLEIDNCAFINNSARGPGGALAYSTAFTVIRNAAFNGNRSTNSDGGAIDSGGDAQIINCTFVHNAAPLGRNGGIRGFGGTAVTNSILWANTDGLSGTNIQRQQFDSVSNINFCIVQGWTAASGSGSGVQISSADPLFVNRLGPDNAPGTVDDDLRLSGSSPAVDAGYNGGYWGGFSTDLAGQPRFRDVPSTPNTGLGSGSIIDLGCYERQPPTCRADFNLDTALTVADIFDFLNAWFAGLPAADFDASGALAPADIFDFLNAWFAGC